MTKPAANGLLSSIGKKEIVAISGLGALGFLCVHFLGNTTIFFGREAFNAYAEHLHALGVLLYYAELGLAAVFATHIVFAVWVTLENRRARPVPYAVKAKSDQSRWASRLMIWSGLYMLVFIVAHLVNFRAKRGTDEIADLVGNLFSSPGWALYYAVSMALVAFHLSHGIWSAMQTLGVGMANEGFRRNMEKIALGVSIVFGVGFGLMPVLVYLRPMHLPH